MAYVQDDNEDQQQDQQGQVLSAPSAAMDAPATGGSNAPAGGGATPAKPASNQSGMFTNLNSYLDANKGEGARMANDVGTNVAGQAAGADKAGGDWHDAAAKKIADNTVKDTAGTQKAVTEGRIGDVKGEDFNNLYNATYRGPKDHADTAGGVGSSVDAQAAYNQVQDLGKLAGGDDSDRSTLLRNTIAKGQQYRPGESLLDSWLTGASPDASNPNGADNAFAGVARDYGVYGDKFKGLTDDIDKQAADAATSADTLRTGFRGAVDTQQTAEDAAIAKAIEGATGRNNILHGMQADARKGDKTSLQSLGYNPIAAGYMSQGGVGGPMGVYGFDPSTSIGAGTDYRAGDFLDPKIAAAYPQLATLLAGAGVATPMAHQGTDLSTTGDLSLVAHGGYDPTLNTAALAQAAKVVGSGNDTDSLAPMDPGTAAALHPVAAVAPADPTYGGGSVNLGPLPVNVDLGGADYGFGAMSPGNMGIGVTGGMAGGSSWAGGDGGGGGGSMALTDNEENPNLKKYLGGNQ